MNQPVVTANILHQRSKHYLWTSSTCAPCFKLLLHISL